MSSPYSLILADVNTLAGQISTWETSTTRAVRKQIIKMEGETLPLLIIVPFYHAVVDGSFEGGAMIRYTVGIASLFDGNRNFETLTNSIDAMYALRQKLDLPKQSDGSCLPTATTVQGSEIDLNPDPRLFDLSALEKNVDYSLMTVSFDSRESRN